MPRVALFIDAENVAPDRAGELKKICSSHGTLAIARCYGNLASMTAWSAAGAKHELKPELTPGFAAKPNASDFALVIDAVACFHRGLYQCAVLASADKDFALLVAHLREHGAEVLQLGAIRQVSAASAPPAAAPPKPSASPTVRTEWLRSEFQKLQDETGAAALHALYKALKASDAGYWRTHGGPKKYLEESGLFETDGKVIRLRTTGRKAA